MAARAWPAKEQVKLGNWVLRANDGVTRRANSVYPAGDPLIDVHEAIDKSIEFYQSRSLQPRFQVTPASQPECIDDVLEESGFEIGLRVAIQVAKIDSIVNCEARFMPQLTDSPTDSWMDAYKLCTGHDDFSVNIRKGIMSRIPGKKVFALCVLNDEYAGVGLGVIEDEWVGLFGLATNEKYRRQGVATSVNKAIGIWARDYGSNSVYLQAEVLNTPAISLYSKIGFETIYDYWYRDYSIE